MAPEEIAPDEAFCTSCGEAIKAEAEVCPECGVRQTEDEADGESENSLPEHRVYELQKIARKSPAVAVALGILVTPGAYIYTGKWGLAAVNFFSLNYFLLGFFIVPFHTYKIIHNAREELERNGEQW